MNEACLLTAYSCMLKNYTPFPSPFLGTCHTPSPINTVGAKWAAYIFLSILDVLCSDWIYTSFRPYHLTSLHVGNITVARDTDRHGSLSSRWVSHAEIGRWHHIRTFLRRTCNADEFAARRAVGLKILLVSRHKKLSQFCTYPLCAEVISTFLAFWRWCLALLDTFHKGGEWLGLLRLAAVPLHVLCVHVNSTMHAFDTTPLNRWNASGRSCSLMCRYARACVKKSGTI